MALNAKKEMLAFYVETDSGSRVIVLKSDLKKELNRQEIKMSGATSLVWVGNDTTLLTFPDKIMLVGPNSFKSIYFNAKKEGIHCFNEIDGLRVVTSDNAYFLERVQEPLVKTFKIASISPSA